MKKRTIRTGRLLSVCSVREGCTINIPGDERNADVITCGQCFRKIDRLKIDIYMGAGSRFARKIFLKSLQFSTIMSSVAIPRDRCYGSTSSFFIISRLPTNFIECTFSMEFFPRDVNYSRVIVLGQGRSQTL